MQSLYEVSMCNKCTNERESAFYKGCMNVRDCLITKENTGPEKQISVSKLFAPGKWSRPVYGGDVEPGPHGSHS